MAWGCDLSHSRDQIDYEQMARDGVEFVCRYLRGSGKALLPEEAARISRLGMRLVSNDETTGTMYLGGFDGGRRDAKAALAAAVACGMPANGRPIYFTPLDHDPAGLDDAGWSTLRSYARGVVDVLSPARTGWYGGTRMLRDFQARNLGRWWWQARGWRDGIDTQAEAAAEGWHLRQYQNGVARWGGEVDYDQALQADYGQWSVGAPTQEDDMALGDATKLYFEGQFDRIIHYLDHGDDTAGSKSHHQQIRAEIAALRAAVDATQTTAGTILLTVRSVINQVKLGNTDLAANIDSTRSAVLGALAALPGLSDEQAQAVVDGVVAGIAEQGVQVDPAAVLEALRMHPLVPSP